MLETCPYSCPVPAVIPAIKKVSVTAPDLKKIEDEKFKIPLWILVIIAFMLVTK